MTVVLANVRDCLPDADLCRAVAAEVERRLVESVRDGDTVSEEADGSYVVVYALDEADGNAVVLARIATSFERPVVAGRRIVPVRASVGGVIVGRRESPAQALARARRAAEAEAQLPRSRSTR